MALTFPNKGPDEILDYPVDFGDLIPPERSISRTVPPIVTIIRPSPTESPTDLTIPSPGIFVSASGGESPLLSPLRLDTVTVWLQGGTLSSTYTIRVEVQDDLPSPRPRTFVRFIKIKIKEKTE